MERNAWLLPAAIVIAGALLGTTIYFVRSNGTTLSSPGDISTLRPVTASDHIVGNPSADVVLIEYSDVDCTYCKQFREALEQAMTDYGPDGNVAWVYRHLPDLGANENAAKTSEAAECVASLGGENLFFRFLDAAGAATPGTARLTPRDYDTIAASLGVSQSALDSCLSNGTFSDRVSQDVQNAVQIGAAGTPYSVLLIKGHEPVPISGALPYAALKQILDAALAKAKTPEASQ